jgi:hypothetical protein
MKSRTTDRFRHLLADAPQAIQEKARAAFRLWSVNPSHPSLQFKNVHSHRPVYSARIDLNWRAVGILEGSDMIWFWIGPHDKYERLLNQIHDSSDATWSASI